MQHLRRGTQLSGVLRVGMIAVSLQDLLRPRLLLPGGRTPDPRDRLGPNQPVLGSEHRPARKDHKFGRSLALAAAALLALPIALPAHSHSTEDISVNAAAPTAVEMVAGS